MAQVHIVWDRSLITEEPYIVGVYRHLEDAQDTKGRDGQRIVTSEDIMESVEQPITLHLETGQQMTLSPKEQVMVQEKSFYARQLKEGDSIKVSRRESTHDFPGDTKPVYVKILKIRTANSED